MGMAGILPRILQGFGRFGAPSERFHTLFWVDERATTYQAERTKPGWTIMSSGKEKDLSPMFFRQTSHADCDNLCKLDKLGQADSSTGV